MRKKMPEFKSEEEEALFWSKHSPLDYPDEAKAAEKPFEFAMYLLKRAAKEHKEKKRLLTFRMEQSQILLAKIIAKKYGDNYQSLLRKWIRERIYEEIKGNPNIAKDVRKQNLRLV
ncbi:MAG: CopG family antitoxin [Candidatus Omnitrophica bacterium]|nr:CopG family antitoxin [Candidatus Omnitrophota bacterium]